MRQRRQVESLTRPAAAPGLHQEHAENLILAPNKADGPNAQCCLTFGAEALYLRKSPQPDGKPYVDHCAYTIENYNHEAVGAELRRRGLNPQPDGTQAWAIRDPDGLKIELTGKELPERG